MLLASCVKATIECCTLCVLWTSHMPQTLKDHPIVLFESEPLYMHVLTFLCSRSAAVNSYCLVTNTIISKAMLHTVIIVPQLETTDQQWHHWWWHPSLASNTSMPKNTSKRPSRAIASVHAAAAHICGHPEPAPQACRLPPLPQTPCACLAADPGNLTQHHNYQCATLASNFCCG